MKIDKANKRSVMPEKEKIEQILKMLLLLNPRPESCLEICEFAAKHGAFNGSFKEVKGVTHGITGRDEKSILAGKQLAKMEAFCRVAIEELKEFRGHASLL